MQSIKILIRKIVSVIIKIISSNRYSLRLCNIFYELAPNKILAKIEPLMPSPTFNFTWNIKVNKQTVNFTYLKNEERIIYHFPLSYKKNDFGIRKLEEYLDSFYSKETRYFDIGANFGMRSIYFVSKGRYCYLFEPNEKCNEITRRFMNENKFTNYEIVNKIVGEKTETKQFHLSKSTYLSSVAKDHSENYNDYLKTIVIEQITIDKFMYEKQLENKIGIIKIDVEGYEYEVCVGAIQLLAQPNITLLIEVLEESTRKTDLFKLLNRLNYTIYGILQDQAKVKLELMSDDFTNKTIDFICTNNIILTKQLDNFH